MVRVSHPKLGKQAASSNGVRGAKVSKQRNRHKVVFEDVEQKKQKSLYFRTDPPPGYTFIPAGNPQLTEALKEFAKKGNYETFAVTTTPHASRHELSREVHRIGWHFPTEVVARVCNYYGIRLTASGKLVEDKDDDKLFMKVYQKGQLVLDEKVRDQVTINTDAKQIIKDLFPNIPDNDLFKIIKTAFQVGDGKVGTADEIPLVRRAQLSVVAHIRHTYTKYDKLLRQVPYNEARHSVENETLKKLIEWRGDDENKEAVEDTLREVVVISDEEGSDGEVEDGQILDHDDVHVQLINDAARLDQNSAHRPLSPTEQYPGDLRPGGFRYLPQTARRLPAQSQSELIAAQQRSRYAVWDRYRQQHRTTAAPQPPQVVRRILLEDPIEHPSSYSPAPKYPPYDSKPQRVVSQPLSTVAQQSSPTYVRGSDGRIYERIVRPPEDSNGRMLFREEFTPPQQTTGTRYIDTQSSSARPYPAQAPSHKRNISFDDSSGTVVPSIEGSNGAYQPSPHHRQHAESSSKRHSTGSRYYLQQDESMSSHENPAQNVKRQRLRATPPSPLPQQSRYDTWYPGHENDPQQPYHTGDGQRYVQRIHDTQEMIDDRSSRMLRQQVNHDSVMNTSVIQSAGNMTSSYSYPRDNVPLPISHAVTQPDQARPVHYVMEDDQRTRRYAPVHVDDRRSSTFVTGEGISQYGMTRSSQVEPVRYVQFQDGDVQQRGVHLLQQAGASRVQAGEYVPIDMARRTSAQDRVYDAVPRAQPSYYQPVLQQASQYRR